VAECRLTGCRRSPVWAPLSLGGRRGWPGTTLQIRFMGITIPARFVRGDLGVRRQRLDPLRCGLMSFTSDDLERLNRAEEIDIETNAPDGLVHRTTIWVVVDGDEAFVRSVRGAKGRWYREAMANPAVAVHVDGRRLAATAIPATDPDSIDRTTEALRRKYEKIPGFAPMIKPDVLDTTLRLEPA
jgi:hypothetical protein